MRPARQFEFETPALDIAVKEIWRQSYVDYNIVMVWFKLKKCTEFFTYLDFFKTKIVL